MRDINYNEIPAKIRATAAAAENVENLLWSIIDDVIDLLNYDDCVIYLYDERKQALIQRAASGAKRKDGQLIKDPIRIEPGEGIVGRVFQFGSPRIIGDTSTDANYIIDDRFRLSEISIPIFHDEKVIGVIDSEHPSENFYSDKDKEVLTAITEILVERLFELGEL